MPGDLIPRRDDSSDDTTITLNKSLVARELVVVSGFLDFMSEMVACVVVIQQPG